MKQTWNPGTMISPLPPALIGSGDMTTPNVMTAAWTGIICSDPVITYVSIRPSRYTHELVSKHKEFTINIPTWKIASEVDTVGVKTGRNINKFQTTGLIAEPSTKIKAPQIAQCPISIECKVLEIRPFGTHDMFLAEVVAVNVDDTYIDENGALDLEKAGLLAYAHGFYYTLGRKIGKFGFSVEKKHPTLKLSTEKFAKENSAKKFQKAKEETSPKSSPSKLNVVLKKNKLKKPEKKTPNAPKAPSTNKTSKKFAAKNNKTTNYTQTTYHKKSDGSFKKKLTTKEK